MHFMTDEELIASGAAIDHEATATARALGPPGCATTVWVNKVKLKQRLLAGLERLERDDLAADRTRPMLTRGGDMATDSTCPTGQHVLASMRVEPRVWVGEQPPPIEWYQAQDRYNFHMSNMVELLNMTASPVPDSQSEIAVTANEYGIPEIGNEFYLHDYYLAKAEAERDAERARAEVAEKELSEETRLREFWRDRCFAAEKELAVIIEQRRQARGQYELMCEEAVRQAAEREAREADRAQIVRLMAERDEAQAERNALRDDLAMTAARLGVALTQAVTQTPVHNTPTHNPFREFGGDRRRVGS